MRERWGVRFRLRHTTFIATGDSFSSSANYISTLAETEEYFRHLMKRHGWITTSEMTKTFLSCDVAIYDSRVCGAGHLLIAQNSLAFNIFQFLIVNVYCFFMFFFFFFSLIAFISIVNLLALNIFSIKYISAPHYYYIFICVFYL